MDGLHPYLRHCNEHVGAETSSRSWFQCLCIFTQKWDYDSSESYGSSIFTFFWGSSSLFSPVAAPLYIPANRARGFPILCSFTNTIFWFLISAVLPGVRRSLTGVLTQISLGSGDTDHLFIYLLAICLSSLWPILKIKLFLLLSCRTPYCLPEVLFCLSQSKCPRVCISMQQELGESVTRCAPLGI